MNQETSSESQRSPAWLFLSDNDAVVRALDKEFERLYQAEEAVLQIQRKIQVVKRASCKTAEASGFSA